MTAPRSPGICLNMIVKNETKVLDRLFRSVRGFIDYYVIVDTGSTDGTPDYIVERMGAYGIAGEVHSREWVNFGVNRDQALQLAYASNKCGWVLIVDADEEIGCSNPGFFSTMKPGISYELEKHHGDMRYALPNLVDVSSTRWQWQGPVHEYLTEVEGIRRRQRCNDAWIIFHEGEGARSQGVSQQEKFLRDARILEVELKKNPNDYRNRFYLAQSYRDAGELRSAYDQYRLRAAMTGGWEPETFVAQWQAGRMARLLGMPHGTVLEELLAAYNLRPSRSEPLHELAVHCRSLKRYGEAYLFAKMGSLIPTPADTLFVHHDVYDWRLLDELSIACYWTGRFQESRELCEKLLQLALEGYALSREDLRRMEKNLAFAVAKC